MPKSIEFGKIVFECHKCGSTEFSRSTKDDDIATCAACGFSVSLADVKAINKDKAKEFLKSPSAKKEAAKIARELFKSALKKK